MLGFAAGALLSTSLASTASAQGLEFLHSHRVEGGRVCFADHFHAGSSSGETSRAAAERAAIASWVGFTALEYGNLWGRWSLAASKSVNCSRSVGWGCQVEARPCRMGGRSRS